MAASRSGTYVLFFEMGAQALCVGSLGWCEFRGGLYAYVGSALGSGGLAARLARHKRPQKKLHWHVDYVLAHARVVDAYSNETGRRLECKWAAALREMPGAVAGPSRFGASDCNCTTHLFYLGGMEDGQSLVISALAGIRP